LIYEIARKLSQQSYQHWVSYELFSFGWFLLVIVNVIFYFIWLKLLDKSRISHLLLIGSLSAVGFLIGDLFLFGFLGVAEYKVSITPTEPALFIMSVTIAPIIIMLVQQYRSSWKGYLLWISIGMAFLAFILMPIYSLVGILQLHNWNYFYHFLYLLIVTLMVRVVFLWIIGIEQRHPSSGN